MVGRGEFLLAVDDFLDAHIGALGLQAGLAERLGTRDARDAERFDRALLEDHLAGVVPSLSRQNFDLDIVETVELYPLFVDARPALLHDQPAVRQHIPPANTGKEQEKEQP